MKGTEILLADYKNKQQSRDVVTLLNQYAVEPMGGSKPLKEWVRDNLISSMAMINGAFSVLAYVDGVPVGLTNCLPGFSSFACKPLINIHDVYVAPQARGMRLTQKMFDQVIEVARDRNCCKLTLEVLEGNTIAQKVYHHAGFKGYEMSPEQGQALFWEKSL